MPFTPIYNPAPVEVPAVAAKTYPNSYILGLSLDTGATIHQQRLATTLRPYNHETGDAWPDDRRDWQHDVADVWNEAQRSSLFAQWMALGVQVCGLAVEERDLINRLAVAAADDKPAIEVRLAEVRTAYGVS